MTSQYPSNPQRPEHNQYGQYGQSGSGYPQYNGAANHQQSAHHQQPAQRKANIPGIIAVVIAALAILFSFVPMLGIVAIVPSLIAICLGIAGVASSTYQDNRGWAVAGIIGGGIALAMSVIMPFFTAALGFFQIIYELDKTSQTTSPTAIHSTALAPNEFASPTVHQ